MEETTARIGFRVRGAYLAQLREVQDMMGFNTPTETVQYLAQRGLEGLSSQIATRRMLRKVEGLASPQEMLPLLAMLGVQAPQTLKEAEKTP